MKRLRRTGVLLAFFVAVHAGIVVAQSMRTTPAIESLFRQAIGAIETEQYIRATQLLTRLLTQPEHVHSQRAQELLGNVREANGQLAHAVAEYEIYLERYPDGPGALRVSTRLNAILTGATPLPQQPEIEAAEADTTVAPRPVIIPPRGPQPIRRGGRRVVGGAEGDPNATTITDRGNVRLTYRYNEGATEITRLNPDPIPDITEEEDDVLNNALTTSLRFSRIIENAEKKVTLSFSGSYDVDFEDSEENEFRLFEFSAEWLDKESGRELTAGRQRMKPSGVAYRLDGVSLRWPSDSGIEYGVFAGASVESTRDDFLESDSILYGVSATWPEGAVGPGTFSSYIVEEREGSFTNRRALGFDYDLDLENGGVFANAEIDLQFGELNRALLTGTRILPGNARLTGRLAYYRSPRLSLQNALIGQGTATLGTLSAMLTDDELEELAIARSSNVTTLGLTYYGPLSDKWNISAFGSLYHTSGTPATLASPGVNAVAAVDAEGVQSYLGFQFIGSSIWRERDQLSFGLRHSHDDDSDLFVADSSLRYPLTDKLTISPRIRVGYRDYEDGSENEFVIPSVNARYRIDRQTSIQLDIGGRWSKNSTATRITRQDQFFATLGISRSF